MRTDIAFGSISKQGYYQSAIPKATHRDTGISGTHFEGNHGVYFSMGKSFGLGKSCSKSFVKTSKPGCQHKYSSVNVVLLQP